MSHVFLEISAHLLCVTSSAYRLEHLDKARPILEQPLKVKEGHALVPEGSGIGLDWNENAVERFLVG